MSVEMKDEYDVVVVGGGPSGAMAAKFAALGGASVLLIEKRQEIGTPIRCAEGVGLKDMDRFLDLQPRHISQNISGATIYAPDGTALKLRAKEGEIAGYILERKVFDRSLVESAAKAGADVFTKSSATSLIMEKDTVVGVKISRLDVEKEIRCKIIIGADGVESKVGRWAGLCPAIKLKDIESGVQFLMTDIDIDSENIEFFMGNQYAPGGYVWIFPKGKDRANVGIGLLGSKIKDGGRPIDYLNEFVKKRFPDGKIAEINYGGVPVSGGLEKMYGKGIMLVGDAAQCTDPITGGGIKSGLWSGELAGKVAADAVKSGNWSEKALSKYQHDWEKLYGKPMRVNLVLKDYYVDMTDEEANKLAHELAKHDFTGVMEVPDLVKILSKVDKKLLLKLGAAYVGF
ncbi:NAD(P)/FAD-dependent oxidoreductase [Methanolapillus millepedarum]|uniref:Digeranylgeranylglycerophospholipid reductase n=1 Tax=Methanolapillus millepedarum TaxID=3028296 RepID=A0AA96ZTN6_9EURY|nr:Thiamine thiazole synthase [Methanosarcinaceae archaeon Ac7]